MRLGNLAFVALLIGVGDVVLTSAVGQDRSETPAPSAADPEQTVVIIGRQTTFVSQSFATQHDGRNESFSITRDAQKQLQRLGCYDGEITGIWSPSSRAAAQRFLDRVNAKLPTEKADAVLLALLSDQTDAVCSQCPRGQGLDSAGRCTPTALLKRTAAPVVTGAVPDTTKAPVRSNDERIPTTQVVEEQTPTGQRTQPNSKPSKWQKFIRKVDKALGLN